MTLDRKSINNYRWGIFWSFLSAFLWATVYIVSRSLMSDENARIDPVSLSRWRFSIGGIILFAICLVKYRKQLFVLELRDFVQVILLSLFSVVGMSVLLFWGQRFTTAINSSMIMSSSPVLIMLLGLFIGEKINRFQLIGLVISTTGCMIVIGVISLGGWNYSLQSFRGDLLVFGSELCWAIGAILAKGIMKKHHDMAITAWSMLFAALLLSMIDLLRGNLGSFPSDTSARWLILYLGIFPTAIGFYAWNAALARISLNIVSVMQYLTPMLVLIMAWIILGEHLNGLKIVGALLVIGGVLVTSRARREKTLSIPAGTILNHTNEKN